MAESLYVIWSTPLHGWVTRTATYSSDLEDAKRFSRDEAIKACQGHLDRQSRGFGWIPVYVNDLEAVKSR